MSLNKLILNKKKPWLDARVNQLIVDGEASLLRGLRLEDDGNLELKDTTLDFLGTSVNSVIRFFDNTTDLQRIQRNNPLTYIFQARPGTRAGGQVVLEYNEIGGIVNATLDIDTFLTTGNAAPSFWDAPMDLPDRFKPRSGLNPTTFIELFDSDTLTYQRAVLLLRDVSENYSLEIRLENGGDLAQNTNYTIFGNFSLSWNYTSP